MKTTMKEIMKNKEKFIRWTYFFVGCLVGLIISYSIFLLILTSQTHGRIF